MTLERDLQVFEGMRNKVPPGEDFPTAAIKALFDYAAGAGIPLRTGPEGMRLWGGEIFLFPNFFFLPQYENALVVPGAPVQRRPRLVPVRGVVAHDVPRGPRAGAGDAPGSLRHRRHRELGPHPAPGLQQHGAPAARRALAGLPESRLATEMEQAISNMHMELDRYLSR